MRCVHRPNVGTSTVDGQSQVDRRRSRRSANITRTLNAMKDGADLVMSYEHGRPIWELSTGFFITKEAAAAAINDPHVVGTGDCLFSNVPSQTYRWVDNVEGRNHE